MIIQNKQEKAALALKEILSSAIGISNEKGKSHTLEVIFTELVKQNRFDEALTCIGGISDVSLKIKRLAAISTVLSKQGNPEEAAIVMKQAIFCAEGLRDELTKSSALESISINLVIQGEFEEGLSWTGGISYDLLKSRTLARISEELAKQGRLDVALICLEGISNERLKIIALAAISTELSKQEKYKEAATVMKKGISLAERTSDNWYKSNALSEISAELAKQGMLEEALSCAKGISDDREKSNALSEISTELAKLGKLEEALSCAGGINDDDTKSYAFREICAELAKQGRFEEALFCATGISDELWKSSALKDISAELAKQGKLEEAEAIGLEIPHLAERHQTWIGIAKEILEIQTPYEALLKSEEVKSEEANLFYKRGWAQNVNVVHANAELVYRALPFLAEDTESLEVLLQKYAQYTLCFGKPQPVLVERLNRTLNVQWMMDIVAQFPQPQNQNRQSTNLEEWISSITDEDTRDQIELWAFKVGKGSMTEEAFAKKVASLLN
jgi:hypothetical protein